MTWLLLAATFLSAPGDASLDRVGSPSIPWDRRSVEHLWNRAAFGIRPDEIERWLDAGPEAVVDHLLRPRAQVGEKASGRWVYEGPTIDPVEFEQRTVEKRREYRTQVRNAYMKEFARLRSHWVRQMVKREDPLRDRLTLFWHGVFTSSYDTVRLPDLIGRQHETLRRGALGSYGELLRAMLRDPALLAYLNNDSNKKGKPNENLAREVMELFSLGEGSGYTEVDVKEAARALTGAGLARRREEAYYYFHRSQHDGGKKTILGVKGRHGPEELADILLSQPACATFIARSLIEYFEGVPVEGTWAEARLNAYAERLRSTDYDVRHFMRALLLDPAFYRDEVIGARIASPIDYLVGTHIRLGGGVPIPFHVEAASALGQDLFRPPNVKGWEEGIAWISTASFMLRGNVAGAMVGRIDRKAVRKDAEAFLEDLAAESPEGGAMAEMSMEAMSELGREQARRDVMNRLTKILGQHKYKPRKGLFAALRKSEGKNASNGQIVAALADRLLAIEPPPEALRMLEGRLASLRLAKGETGAGFLGRVRAAEPILREVCHLILSLPEAQLH